MTMQTMNVHAAMSPDAPSQRAPWLRVWTVLRHHPFWGVSLAIHAAVLSLALPFPHPIPSDEGPIVMTARLAPPGRAPTVELPSLPPPPKSAPKPQRHSVTARSATHVPKLTFTLPRFIATKTSASVWAFWFPTLPAASVEQNPVGPTTGATTAGNGPGGPPMSTASGGNASDEFGGSFIAPAYLKTPLPVYPSIAKTRHWEGIAVLHVEVLIDGTVNRVELLHSSGHRELDESALKAVHTWKFEPAKRGDIAVTCFIQVPVRFKLDS